MRRIWWLLLALVAAGLWWMGASQAHAEGTTPDGMDETQFAAAGALAQQAGAIADELHDDPGYGWVVYRDGHLVVIGRGAAVAQAAARHGAVVDEAAFNPGVPDAAALRDLVQSRVGLDGVKYVGEGTLGLVIGAADPDRRGTGSQTGRSAGLSLTELARELGNVTVDTVTGDARPSAVYGGSTQSFPGGPCSLGFPMWAPDGSSAYLTAGHCSSGRTGLVPTVNGSPFGVYSQSVWGAPGSAVGSWGTDLAVLSGVPSDTPPAVIRHGAGGTVTITGRTDPIPGLPVCKSGQTTGWTCGSIAFNGWLWVAEGTYANGRWVYSAASNDVNVYYGDSGGAWVSGNKALGITSSVYDNISNPNPVYRSAAAPAHEMDTYFPGHELKLHVPQPWVNGGDQVSWGLGWDILAQVPPLAGDSVEPGTRVRVSIDGKQTQDLAVDASGVFWFRYDATAGVPHSVSLQAYHGRSTSTPRTVSVAPVVAAWQQAQAGVVGTAEVGRVLQAEPGTWLPAPDRLDMQWFRRTAAGDVAIPGAAGPQYRLTPADQGSQVLVRLTGSRLGLEPLVKDSSALLVGGQSSGLFRALAPSRLVDTRSGLGRSGSLRPGETARLQVTGRAGVPTGATAVVLNVTSTDTTAPGVVVVRAAGGARPVTSNLNPVPGREAAAAVTTPVSADGGIDVEWSSPGTTHLVVDVVGYYVPSAGRPGSLGVMDAYRLVDTRDGLGARGPVLSGRDVVLQVADLAGVPANASAVIVSVVVTQPTSAGYASLRPSDAPLTPGSMLNWTAGMTRANAATVALGTDGSVVLHHESGGGNSQFVVDVLGWYAGVAPTDPGAFVPTSPVRLLETRPELGGSGTMSAQALQQVPVSRAGAGAVVGNLTAIQPRARGFGRLYPTGVDSSSVSSINFLPGDVVPNQVHTALGAGQQVSLLNAAPGRTDYVLDLQGWFLG